MSLELKITKTGINPLGTELYLEDGTGNYSVDNPGGWGVPNDLRASKALLIAGKLHTTSGDADIVFDEIIPDTADAFLAHIEKDGYHEFRMIAVDMGNPTVEGSYGWSTTNGLTQFSGGILVPKTIWEVTEDATFTDKASLKTVILNRVAIERNRRNQSLLELKMQKYDDKGHNREIVQATEDYNFTRTQLEGARYQWCMENFMNAQKIVESVENMLSDE